MVALPSFIIDEEHIQLASAQKCRENHSGPFQEMLNTAKGWRLSCSTEGATYYILC